MYIATRYQHAFAARLGALVLLLGASAAQAQIPVPSGQPVELNDVLLDENPGELWLRFRFVAPKIGDTAGRIGYDVAALDMEFLCNELAIPYIAKHSLDPARVVISLADRSVEFGRPDALATQFFEAYRLEDARCIWEEF